MAESYWTPQYAAQIMELLRQSQLQNPETPGLGEPGIAPMGGPGSLTPPPTAPAIEEPPVVPPGPVGPTRAEAQRLGLAENPPGPPVPPTPLPANMPQGPTMAEAQRLGLNARPGGPSGPLTLPQDQMTPTAPTPQMLAPMGGPPAQPPGLLSRVGAALGMGGTGPSPGTPLGGYSTEGLPDVPTNAGWQQFLPMIASFAFSMHPRTRHMAALPMYMGKQVQESYQNKQALVLQSNVDRIMQEQGPIAAKRYLTDIVTKASIDPKSLEPLRKRLQEGTDRLVTSESMAELQSTMTGQNLERRAPAIAKLFLSNDPAKAATIIDKLVPEVKPMVVGRNLIMFDPATKTATPVYQGAEKDMKMSDLAGGQDIEREVVEVTGGDTPSFLKRFTSDNPEERSQAQAQLLQAKNLADARDAAKRAESHRAMLSAAEITARAMAKQKGEVLPEPTQKRLLEIEDTWNVAQDALEKYDPKFSGPIAGRLGGVRTALGFQYKDEAEYRQNTITLMNQRIKYLAGVAVNPNEFERALAEMPNVNDPPAVFRSKMNGVITRLKRGYDSSFTLATTPMGELKRRVPETAPRGAAPTTEGTPAAPKSPVLQEGEDPDTGIKWKIRK